MTWIGIGTHVIKRDSPQAIRHAVSKGVLHFDTAPNYHYGQAHQCLREVLPNNLSIIKLATKVGYFSKNLDKKIISTFSDDLVNNNILNQEYTYTQGIINFRELGGHKINCLYIHNPENHLARLTKGEFEHKIVRVFEACERLCDEGVYDTYGIATWSRFLEQFSIKSLIKLSKMAGGEKTRFRSIQAPLSLVRIEYAKMMIEGTGGVINECFDEGINYIASSPLHTGEIPKYISKSLLEKFHEYIPENIQLTPAQFSIHFVRSIIGVSGVYVSCSTLDQSRELVALKDIELFDRAVIKKTIKLLT